ncbi:MAG: paraquat-inducible protein A [Verrucomicrobia bacterium]|nr:paraquat-inducible protein A [Verrucomicrobiota bacterium]
MNSNAKAALVAFAGLLVFFPAIFLPCLTVFEFGRPRTVSLAGGVTILWQDGHVFLAGIVALFTLLFPPAKLAIVLVVTSQLAPGSPGTRHRLNAWISHMGRYSMVDPLIIAIAVVSLKMGGYLSVEPAIGTYLFLISVFLSMAASSLFCVKPSNITGVNDAKPQPIRQRLTRFGVVGIVLLAVGTAFFVGSTSGVVREIRVSKREGMLDLQILTPSYYVKIQSLEGEISTPAYPSTPIGNGLTWVLQKEIPIGHIQEIQLLDQRSLLPDKLVDRVNVAGWRTNGQNFSFELRGRSSWGRTIALASIGVGAIVLLYLTGAFLIRHAVKPGG